MHYAPSVELSPRQINCIRNSWRNFRDINPGIFSETFSEKLLADHPAAKKVFRNNLLEHFIFFHEMMNLLVSRIDRPEAQDQVLARMAHNNDIIGINRKLYSWMGDALLWTLERGMGAEWNAELQQSWCNYYQLLVQNICKLRVSVD